VKRPRSTSRSNAAGNTRTPRDEWLGQLPTGGLYTRLTPAQLAELLTGIAGAFEGGFTAQHTTTRSPRRGPELLPYSVEWVLCGCVAEPRWWMEYRIVVDHLDPPFRMVDLPVMAQAQQHEIM
jgi:hypothetical protein